MNFFKRMFQSRQPATQQGLDDQLRDWKIIRVDTPDEGLKAIFRLRITRPPLPPGRRFDTCIIIAWPYEGNLPDKELKAQQMEMDEALDELTGPNGFSELMFISTGYGIKEWNFYSSDRERFMREFNRLLASHPPYPLKIEFIDDPEWQIWSRLMDDVRASGAL